MMRSLVLCLALLALAACGMKGDPVAPKDAKKEAPAQGAETANNWLPAPTSTEQLQ